MFFEPHLFGMTLHRSMLVKYLGVVPDSWLTWREHMDVKMRLTTCCGPVGGPMV